MKSKILTLVLLTLILTFLTSCFGGSGSSSDTTTTTTDTVYVYPDEPDSTSDTPEPKEPGQIDHDFLVRTDSGLYFSDGVSMEYFSPASTIKAGPYKFVSGSTFITLDESGQIDTSTDLNHSPTAALVTTSNFWSCIEISREESIAIGARPGIYTEIFKNEASDPWMWLNNTFGCDRIIKSGDSIFVFDGATPHVIDGPAINLNHVSQDFYIHGRDATQSLIFFNDGTSDYQETYATNYILNAKQWQKYGDLYYSENGFTWSVGSRLQETDTTLDDFNHIPYPITPPLLSGESPTLLAAGVVGSKIFLIECNTGYLFVFDADVNIYEQKYRLYAGDGLRVSGADKRSTLKPLIVIGDGYDHDKLYFRNDGSLYSLDLDTGENVIFNSRDSWVVNYD